MFNSSTYGFRSQGTSQGESISDSDDGMPSLHSDYTETNIPLEKVEELENQIKKNFKKRLYIKELSRPGICNIFPREEYKLENPQEFIEEEERMQRLWELANKVFKLQRKIQNDKKLTKEYNDKYINFKYLKPDQLHKYSSLDEEEYLK
jgi:hypothetical protein